MRTHNLERGRTQFKLVSEMESVIGTRWASIVKKYSMTEGKRNTMHIETQCLHEGYKPGNGEPKALPIYQSTTYTYDSTDHIGQLFDLTADGHMYSRISNPTVAAVEEKIAALEGGVGALCTTIRTGGQSAGGSEHLHRGRPLCRRLHHLRRHGEPVCGHAEKVWHRMHLRGRGRRRRRSSRKRSAPTPRLVFGETIANPAISCAGH